MTLEFDLYAAKMCISCSWIPVILKVSITVFPPFQAIDAKTIKDVCTRYIFDKAPAIAAVGELHSADSDGRFTLWF